MKIIQTEPVDCCDALELGVCSASGPCEVFPRGISTIVYCDMDNSNDDNGGWLVSNDSVPQIIEYFQS